MRTSPERTAHYVVGAAQLSVQNRDAKLGHRALGLAFRKAGNTGGGDGLRPTKCANRGNCLVERKV